MSWPPSPLCDRFYEAEFWILKFWSYNKISRRGWVQFTVRVRAFMTAFIAAVTKFYSQGDVYMNQYKLAVAVRCGAASLPPSPKDQTVSETSEHGGRHGRRHPATRASLL